MASGGSFMFLWFMFWLVFYDCRLGLFYVSHILAWLLWLQIRIILCESYSEHGIYDCKLGFFMWVIFWHGIYDCRSYFLQMSHISAMIPMTADLDFFKWVISPLWFLWLQNRFFLFESYSEHDFYDCRYYFLQMSHIPVMILLTSNSIISLHTWQNVKKQVLAVDIRKWFW